MFQVAKRLINHLDEIDVFKLSKYIDKTVSGVLLSTRKKKVQKKIVAARLLLILNSEKFSGCMRQFITDIQIIKMVKTEIVRSYPHCTERDEILCSFIPCGDGVES